ncbi:helix-turn-helix domain-containing protein [Actinomycetospora sp. OC33-EN08]|uniref:Helix-turn-helix domain-containing protein n=1 Tax=Actinomycetospora aurantiaca TaxID=3129233 RepID=A0ABU8MPQ9_9PSEU
MPGGRLTEQERRTIAAGLRDDLTSAQIARRIARPTSTVTREVARNGGATAYRADLAQYASRLRGRRRAPSRSGTPPSADPGDPAVAGYREGLAGVFVDAGLPRTAARVLACLYTAEADGMTAAGLARLLRISPASVSKAVTLLERQSQIRREREGGRRDRYVVDDDVLYRSAMASARATADLGALAGRGVDVFGPDTVAGARLATTATGAAVVAERIAAAADEARRLMRAAAASP